MGRYRNNIERLKEIEAYIGELGESLEKGRYGHCKVLQEDIELLIRENIYLLEKQKKGG